MSIFKTLENKITDWESAKSTPTAEDILSMAWSLWDTFIKSNQTESDLLEYITILARLSGVNYQDSPIYGVSSALGLKIKHMMKAIEDIDSGLANTYKNMVQTLYDKDDMLLKYTPSDSLIKVLRRVDMIGSAGNVVDRHFETVLKYPDELLKLGEDALVSTHPAPARAIASDKLPPDPPRPQYAYAQYIIIDKQGVSVAHSPDGTFYGEQINNINSIETLFNKLQDIKTIHVISSNISTQSQQTPGDGPGKASWYRLTRKNGSVEEWKFHRTYSSQKLCLQNCAYDCIKDIYEQQTRSVSYNNSKKTISYKDGLFQLLKRIIQNKANIILYSKNDSFEDCWFVYTPNGQLIFDIMKSTATSQYYMNMNGKEIEIEQTIMNELCILLRTEYNQRQQQKTLEQEDIISYLKQFDYNQT